MFVEGSDAMGETFTGLVVAIQPATDTPGPWAGVPTLRLYTPAGEVEIGARTAKPRLTSATRGYILGRLRDVFGDPHVDVRYHEPAKAWKCHVPAHSRDFAAPNEDRALLMAMSHAPKEAQRAKWMTPPPVHEHVEPDASGLSSTQRSALVDIQAFVDRGGSEGDYWTMRQTVRRGTIASLGRRGLLTMRPFQLTAAGRAALEAK